MANRPRRPRSNGAPSQGEGTVSPEIAGADEAAAATAAADEPAATDAGADLDAPRPGDAPLPPLETQPALPVASADQQREGERDRATETEVPVSESAGSDPLDTAGPSGFAQEEGFTDKAGTSAGGRHLGEFEDDETVPSDEGERPRVAGATTAFGEAGTRPLSAEPVPAGPSAGALVGAGLAGAVLALLGGSILAYSGLLPGTGSADGTPAQYASAGDLEMLTSEMSTLRGTVEQLQSAQAAGGSGGDYASTQDLAVLGDRLTAAEQALQNATAGPDEGQVQALQSAQDGAGAAQSAAEAAQGAADEAQATATQARDTAGELATRLDTQETRLAALEQASEQARLSLAAAGLKAAIDRGGGFEPELDIFAAAGGGEAAESLRAFAADGVPTRAELTAEWPEAETAMRRALIQPDEDAGVGGQLLAGLSSLVTVRSTDEPAADDTAPDAVLARMGAAIEAGDDRAFLEQYDGLDPAAQSAGEGFAERVRARQEASTIVDGALADAAGAAPGTEG